MGMASWNMLVSPTLKIGHHANSKVSCQGGGRSSNFCLCSTPVQ